MQTILYCWELGANFGHLLPFKTIADELDGTSIKLVYAVRDVAYARQALGENVTILQAPAWPRHHHFGSEHELASFADVLAMAGFGDPNKLASVVSAWSSLIDLVRPDLIVADFCPGLQLCLFGQDIPIIAIGAGICMPPLEKDRFPPIRGDRAPIIPERALLSVACKVQETRKMPKPSSLQQIFRATETITFGLPELDPYRPFRNTPLYEPPETQPPFVEPPEKRRLFVYMGADTPNLEILIQALATLDMEIEAYLRGDVGPLPEFLKMRGALVHDDPPPLNEVLPRASHVLSQGGIYFSMAALTAGRPHMISPQHAETALSCDMLDRMGVATALDLSGDYRDIANSIKDAILNSQMVKDCRDMATVLASRSLASGKQAVLDAITRLMG